MHLVRSFFGTGWLRVGQPNAGETQFVIGVWREADGTLFGRGQVAGDAMTIGQAEMAPGTVPLLLADGRAVDVTVLRPDADDDFADIYVPRPDTLIGPAGGLIDPLSTRTA